MSNYTFKLPDIGEGIATAEIVAWYVQPGDMVEEDAPLVDMMTDKATVEMTSPVSGRVVELAGSVGDQVAIGATLAILDIADDAATAPAIAATEIATPSDVAPLTPATEVAAREADADVSERRYAVEVAALPEAPNQIADRPALKASASPTVRQRARDLGIDLAQVKIAGEGRVRHGDLDAYLRYNSVGGYAVPGPRRADETIKVIGLRRRIAENMAAAKRHIPHFSYVEEIDVTKLEALRADLNETRGDKPKLTMLPLLVTAICRSVPQFPMMNARFDDEAGVVTRHGAVHLGVATQTPAGLMVPVVRDAQDRNVWQLAGEIKRLADDARQGKSKSEELSGSTLTVTSLGPLGGLATTPVINRPEVAIIGPNKVIERPVFRDGRVVAAKLMNLSISCDHRVVDGWDAASFVQELKRLLETPALLFAI